MTLMELQFIGVRRLEDCMKAPVYLRQREIGRELLEPVPN